jgi:carboxylesterase type B
LQLAAFGGEQGISFQQAIMESGSVFELVATDADSRSFDDALTVAGCDSASQDQEASLECLRSLSWEELVQVQLEVAGTRAPLVDGFLAFLPAVDGDFLPAAPSQLYRTGQVSKVPLIIGWNHNDGSLFTSPTIETEEDVVSDLMLVFPTISNATIQELLLLYPSQEFQADPADSITVEFARASEIVRDILFTCPSLFLASQVGGPSVFIYELNQTALAAGLAAQGFPNLGISHIADVVYIFDEVSKFTDSPADELLAKQMSGSWSSFATSGQPSSASGTTIPGWTPAFASSSDSPELMVIGGGDPGMTGLQGANDMIAREQLVERCAFINSVEVQNELGM